MNTIFRLALVFAVFLTGGFVCARGITNLSPTVEAQIYEGEIRSVSAGMWVEAEWRIEWPEEVFGASSDVLAAIQCQMIDDCFGNVSEFYPTPDKALQKIFSTAYSKLDVPPDEDGSVSPLLRHLDFQANVSIKFADAGSMGYVLEGCHNEGGNGCHSYVKARVFSLSTGCLLQESDFMTASGLKAFPKVFFDRVSRKPDVKPCSNANENDAEAALGNFMIEPEGIRWWLRPYSVFPGYAGVQDMLLTWQELKPLLKPGKEKVFKGIFTKSTL
ncbi:MAG: hypothetical protein PHG71_08365 [Kiritimatiellae bacterium]|nr:hypothetical protein [Kiritimatiellia bacterium]MDD4026419.1 hypothetical protein [Kiritimatiellia bacterium]MDD4623234.1 hypothetical protein [Kiritimatiellia bacterium]